MNFSIKLMNSHNDLQDIEVIWRSCHWGWDESSPSIMETIFNYRWKNIIAYADKKPIGYAGLISDQNVYALIVDMMVIPDFQRQGVGNKIMNKIISECKGNDIKIIKLISSTEGKKLYQSFNFDICPNESPGMMLRL
ncbi:MAG: GNAT family N-acetyltransferase [Bacteriovoracaceae bacterium]|jgi:GNAT superfamily N-acetyltransferase|nr:GNAT family N-acetyltransferase [Bacteriovoracaceae bacterium]